uniref:Uncharacterized protein n=1 Tax=Plectus sambesii TaxID=2011161 RepID=A0A914WMC6_9BILA
MEVVPRLSLVSFSFLFLFAAGEDYAKGNNPVVSLRLKRQGCGYGVCGPICCQQPA